jgi:hypothetical protein
MLIKKLQTYLCDKMSPKILFSQEMSYLIHK